MGGRTTAGTPTSVNSGRWTTIYQKYMTFCGRPVPKSFKFKEITEKITGEIREENAQLCKDLKSLDDYYMEIAVFFLQVGHVRQNLTNADQRRILREMESKLCSNDRLLEYLHAAIGALRALASIARTIRDHVSPSSPSSTSGGAPAGISSTSSTSSSSLSGEEGALLRDLLNEINAISNAVKEDYIAEVGWSPGGSLGAGRQVWDAYASERRQSLRSAGGIDESWFR